MPGGTSHCGRGADLFEALRFKHPEGYGIAAVVEEFGEGGAPGTGAKDGDIHEGGSLGRADAMFGSVEEALDVRSMLVDREDGEGEGDKDECRLPPVSQTARAW
jgi:hypothetical protein